MLQGDEQSCEQWIEHTLDGAVTADGLAPLLERRKGCFWYFVTVRFLPAGGRYIGLKSGTVAREAWPEEEAAEDAAEVREALLPPVT